MTDPRILHCERTGYPPGEVPNLIGCCEACGGQMYEHEQDRCGICDKIVHRGCIVSCLICEAEGCTICIPKDVESGEYLCEEECLGEYNETINT